MFRRRWIGKASSSPGRHRALRDGVLATGGLIVVAIWAAVLLAIWNEREGSIAQAERNAANLSLAFSEQIEHSLTSIDETMRFLEADLAREGAKLDLAAWAHRVPSIAGFAFEVGIIAPDGRLVASTVDPKAAPIDVSDREQFRVHLSGNSDALFISKPMLGRLSQRWSIYLTRRMDNPDGTLARVLVFVLDPDFLIRLYEPADLGDAGVITLVGLDGITRARVGRAVEPQSTNLGVSLEGTHLFAEMRVSASATGIERSPFDNMERVFAFRRVQGYPLVVLIGLGLHDVLAAPNAAARRIVIVTAVVTIVLASLTLYLAVEIGWRGRREAELAAERTKLETANRDLLLSRDAAEAANQAKSEFLANMSHELRTPLNAIIGFSEIMKGELLGPVGDPSYREYANHIFESGNHLLATINDILELSSAESGRLAMHDEIIDVASVVKTIAAGLASDAENAGLVLSVELAGAPQTVLVDEGKLRQILGNLLSNALKFTPRGGRVTLAARRTGEGGLALSIADTGNGMAPENIAVALEPFRQIDGRFSRKVGGAGLGLPLAKILAELHGAALTIESVPGEGTTVTVIFPVERVRAAA